MTSFLTAILHRGLRNDFFFSPIYFFQFLFGLLFPFFLRTFIFPFLFGLLFPLFSGDFYFLFGLLFPFSLWTFISLFSLDFYFPSLLGLLFFFSSNHNGIVLRFKLFTILLLTRLFLLKMFWFFLIWSVFLIFLENNFYSVWKSYTFFSSNQNKYLLQNFS